jgi:hypothetical protein
MLQTIKKFFSSNKGESARGGLGTKKVSKGNRNIWAEKQLKEMGKLGGKLILM